MKARLQEALLRSFRAAGWAGVLGIALLGFALSFDLSGNRALADEADALQRQTHALRRAKPAPLAESERARLERFYAGFPPADELPDILVRLSGYALARGVHLDKADYRSAAESGTPLEKVSLELPARGTYPVLRAWLSDVLDEMPEVAVAGLSLKRQGIASGEVEAQLRLVIYLRRAP
jgi:hypothetical protein